MTVTLNLSAEAIRRLREKAARSGQTLEAYLERLAELSTLAENNTAAERTPEEWAAEWRSWTAGDRTLFTPATDDRESIYADRGE